MTKEVREWYEMAAADLGVAKHLDATYYPKPLEIICYHCRQAAERDLSPRLFCFMGGWIYQRLFTVPVWRHYSDESGRLR